MRKAGAKRPSYERDSSDRRTGRLVTSFSCGIVSPNGSNSGALPARRLDEFSTSCVLLSKSHPLCFRLVGDVRLLFWRLLTAPPLEELQLFRSVLKLREFSIVDKAEPFRALPNLFEEVELCLTELAVYC